MKITHLELTPFYTPRAYGHVSCHVLVRIYTEEGAVGLGEMSDTDRLPDLDALGKQLSGLLIGQDPFDVAPLHEELQRTAFDVGIGASLIRCSVDLALYDLVGHQLGVPVYQLLGGRFRGRLRVCYPIFGHHTKQEFEAQVGRVERVLNLGHDLFRYYVSGDADLDDRFLATLRHRFGDRWSLKSLDLSGRFDDWETPLRYLEPLWQYQPMLVESPCRRDPRLMAEVRRRSEAPISEHIGSLEFAMQLVEHEAVDIFNIATVSLGGLTGAKKLYALAEAAGIKTLIGTTQEASIGTSAQAHLGAAVPNLDFPADCMGPVLYQRDIVRQPVRYEGGCLIVPEGVGLGMAVDEAKLQEAGGG